ncbi:unnamed protein product, partial [Nesidiocoris tenuis]
KSEIDRLPSTSDLSRCSRSIAWDVVLSFIRRFCLLEYGFLFNSCRGPSLPRSLLPGDSDPLLEGGRERPGQLRLWGEKPKAGTEAYFTFFSCWTCRKSPNWIMWCVKNSTYFHISEKKFERFGLILSTIEHGSKNALEKSKNKMTTSLSPKYVFSAIILCVYQSACSTAMLSHDRRIRSVTERGVSYYCIVRRSSLCYKLYYITQYSDKSTYYARHRIHCTVILSRYALSRSGCNSGYITMISLDSVSLLQSWKCLILDQCLKLVPSPYSGIHSQLSSSLLNSLTRVKITLIHILLDFINDSVHPTLILTRMVSVTVSFHYPRKNERSQKKSLQFNFIHYPEEHLAKRPFRALFSPAVT